MPSDRRTWCRVCERHESEVGPISWRGRCETCGKTRMDVNVDGLQAHEGPAFQRWRRGMAASVGAVFPENETESVSNG